MSWGQKFFKKGQGEKWRGCSEEVEYDRVKMW